MSTNVYDTTKGKTGSGNRSKRVGEYNNRGTDFPKSGEDPEFDEKRRQQCIENSKIAAKKRKQMSKFKRKAYWEDQVSQYLAKEENSNSGIDMLEEIDRIIQKTKSDNTKKELLKIKAGILGFNAPTLAVQEEVEVEEKKTAQDSIEKLKSMGIDVSGIKVLDNGDIVEDKK